MANLLGQNIGTNYKGILNLNTLNGNLSGTLQAVTDGDGNASPLTLSTSEVGINRAIALSAGATNVRLINETYTINNPGVQTGTLTGIFLNATETALNSMTHNLMDLGTGGGTYVSRFNVGRVHDAAFRFNSITAATNWRPLYTISRVGAPTTPALSLGVGSGGTGSSAFIASSNDDLYLGTDTSNTFATNIVLKANGVGFVGFGGLTASFPAIKRNAAALEVRLADDSGFAAISASSFTIGGTSTSLASNTLNLAGFNVMFYSSRIYIDNDSRGVAINNNLAIGGGNVATNSSSVLECISTTKGFLPPRMTTAQRDLIATPAAGLVIYNTSTNVLNFYNGSAWGAV